MAAWLNVKHRQKPDPSSDAEFLSCVADLIGHHLIRSMNDYIQHQEITCLEHCLDVSYRSYCLCKKLGLDCKSAARGGLLHDFFLYDWHVSKPYRGLHGYKHPRIALGNALSNFQLSDLERDMILRHMWPLTIVPPRYKESFIVAAVDKYCAIMEICNIANRKAQRRKP